MNIEEDGAGHNNVKGIWSTDICFIFIDWKEPL